MVPAREEMERWRKWWKAGMREGEVEVEVDLGRALWWAR